MSWTTRITIILSGLVSLVLILVWQSIQSELVLFSRILLMVGGASLIGFLVLVGLIGRERYLTIKAQRRATELQADLIESNGDVWVKERIPYQLPDGRIEIRTEYARLGGTRLRVNSHDHIPTESERLFASTQQTTGQTKMLTDGRIIPQLPPSVDLLPLLDRAERVLVKGASDAGKTTLLQHIASRSQGVIIVDPHNKPGTWPRGKILGDGYKFGEIQQLIEWLPAEIERRYKMRSQGDESYKPLTIIIDEFMTIKDECENTKYVFSKAIRECRKIKIRLFIGSHSELLKPLGLEGAGDIREGLLVVRLEVDQITKQRVSTYDVGKGPEVCYIPPFGGMQLFDSVVPEQTIIQPPNEDKRIIELASAGLAYKEITEAAYGPGKYGKFYNDKIDRILAKYGLKVASRSS